MDDETVEQHVQEVCLLFDKYYLDVGMTHDQQIAFLKRIKTHVDNSLAELEGR